MIPSRQILNVCRAWGCDIASRCERSRYIPEDERDRCYVREYIPTTPGERCPDYAPCAPRLWGVGRLDPTV